jgi:DNA-binding CsgD family transcriptional regulator
MPCSNSRQNLAKNTIYNYCDQYHKINAFITCAYAKMAYTNPIVNYEVFEMELTSLNKKQCVALSRRGHSVEAIAEMVGASADTVRAYLVKMGEI